MREYERTLLAGWLSGEHNNYNDFETWEFGEYATLLKAIQKSAPKGNSKIDTAKLITELVEKTKYKLHELAEIQSEYVSASIFYSAYLTMKTFSRKRLFDERTKMDYDKWVSQMERLTRQIDNVGQWGKEIGLVDAFYDDFERLLEEEPIYMGMTGLDSIMGGLKRSELTTIAARPAVGKSTFALQVAEYVATHGRKTLFFALEMDKASLAKRLICKMTGLPFSKLQNPSKEMSAPDDYKTVMWASEKLARMEDKLVVCDSIRTIEAIEHEIKERKPEVVFIDQLSLIRTNRWENSIRERFSYITVNLKRMAMEYKVPIVLMCQLRRNNNSVPTMDELKESGSIEEDSDNILLIHKLSFEEAAEKGFSGLDEDERGIQFIVEKQRNGATGSIYGLFQGENFRFVSYQRQ